MSDVTNDLTQFGYRELGMAGELLSAYARNPHLANLGDGVQVWMNTSSGNVFLSDEDFNVAMMNGESLEPFYMCSECGAEGFEDDLEDHHIVDGAVVCGPWPDMACRKCGAHTANSEGWEGLCPDCLNEEGE